MERIIKLIADHYGMKQIGQATEELAELIVALHHYERVYDASLDASARQEYMHVVEEIADVEIMLEQIKHIFNIPEPLIADWKNYKLHRAFEEMQGNCGTKRKTGDFDGKRRVQGGTEARMVPAEIR